MEQDKDQEPIAALNLVVTDDERPLVRLQPGKQYRVQVVPVLDTDLKGIDKETIEAVANSPARLCGGASTCLAITIIDDPGER